ncbi:MAG: 50S ribosomal protein L15 [Planctomycetota bacterium]|jgi:large subunit ribosomal protein L15
MMIHEITKSVGKHRARKRVGRGESSGTGKTSGRGHKGAASRSGWKRRPGYEGGQMPLIRRIPKRGFSNVQFRTLYHVVNVRHLEARCDAGAAVTAQTLAEAGIIRDAKLPLKVLGDGDLSKKLDVTAARFSAAAKQKIEAAGGTVTVIVRKKWTRSKNTKPKPKRSATDSPPPTAQ